MNYRHYGTQVAFDSPGPPPQIGIVAPECSIVIPNWNGEQFITRALAATVQSAEASGLDYELLVLDDASADNSPYLIASRFPDVRLIRNERNLGFGGTCNRGAQTATGEFLVLLNNDLVPRGNMIGELIGTLKSNPGCFGVGAKTLDWSASEPNHANVAARWTGDGLSLTYKDSHFREPTLFLQGGSCAVRREEFLRLGGFCDLFAPGYWEDYDISYLAVKAGWTNLYNPRAEAYHLGKASMSRALPPWQLRAIRERNAFLFQWLNLTDSDLARQHFLRLPRAAGLAMASNRTRLRGLIKAVGLAGRVKQERLRRMSLIRRTDRSILEEFENGFVPVD